MAEIVNGERIEDSAIKEEAERLRPQYEKVFESMDEKESINREINRECFGLFRIESPLWKKYGSCLFRITHFKQYVLDFQCIQVNLVRLA